MSDVRRPRWMMSVEDQSPTGKAAGRSVFAELYSQKVPFLVPSRYSILIRAELFNRHDNRSFSNSIQLVQSWNLNNLISMS